MRIPAAQPIVLLLTCDRLDMTQTTLESFRKFNPRGWTCYWADDASVNPKAMGALCQQHGFIPIVTHSKRKGCTQTTDEAVQAIHNVEGNDRLVLYLQNDFKVLRKIPLDVCRELLAQPGIGWVRLGPKPGGPIEYPVRFPSNDPIDVGLSSYNYNPCSISLSQTLVELFRDQTCEWNVTYRSMKMKRKAAVFKIPVVFHIGGEIDSKTQHGLLSTPGGIFH